MKKTTFNLHIIHILNTNFNFRFQIKKKKHLQKEDGYVFVGILTLVENCLKKSLVPQLMTRKIQLRLRKLENAFG